MKFCQICNKNKAKIIRPKTKNLVCLDCFFESFELEIHYTIITSKMFKKGERVSVGASGGKDSTVLIHVLHTLN